jgi:hypothetical protein
VFHRDDAESRSAGSAGWRVGSSGKAALFFKRSIYFGNGASHMRQPPGLPRPGAGGGMRLAGALSVMVSGLFLLPAFFVMNGYSIAGDRQTESGSDVMAITATDFHERAAKARRQPEGR